MSGTKLLTLALTVVVVCCFVTACSDDDAVLQYFASQQLNQLPGLRTDMKLGAVLTAEGKAVNYDILGNMFDAYGQADWIPEDQIVTDPSRVLPSLDHSTVVEPSVALGLMSDLLQVQVSERLITTNVKINSIVARTQTVAAPVIDRYLQSSDSLDFRKYLANNVHSINPNLRISVVYRIYRTNRLSIISERGEDISNAVSFGVDDVISIGADYRAKRTLVDKIEIDVETHKAFAVGVALIQATNKDDPLSYRVSWSNIHYWLPPPSEDRYAASITADGFESFEVVEASELGLQPHPSLR
ncbi:MAG: hypothetical protein OXQ29_17455 [Rhodospirillaceae bacterium]|nr:hypothetical protein [Rhodospirillaceae bacterium]